MLASRSMVINGLTPVPFEGVLVHAYNGTRRKHNMKFRQIGHTRSLSNLSVGTPPSRKHNPRSQSTGIIQKSNSPWTTPLPIVPKLQGGWRPCGDYCPLNDVTKPDRYPIPHIQDLLSHLSGKNILTTIDFVLGYYHLPVAPEDIPKTAIITAFGLYEYLRIWLEKRCICIPSPMDTVFQNVYCVFA